MIIIKTENLTKQFNGFTAVDNISFTVNKGEIFGFLGPNGAGKTTTIKMLITLLNPTKGNAEIAGYDSETTAISKVDMIKIEKIKLDISNSQIQLQEQIASAANLLKVKSMNKISHQN